MSDYSSPTLCIGDELAGFEVVGLEPLPELNGTAFVMRHTNSSARTLWISCDDNNKSFATTTTSPSL